MTRLPLLLAAVLAGTVLGGCDDAQHDANDESRSTWQEQRPDDYSFVYRIGGMAGLDRVSVTVRGGRVAAFRVLESAHLGAPNFKPPSIDGVFDLVDDALEEADSDDGVRVEYDERWGFPVTVGVDPIRDAVDDEYGFGIDDFRVLS